MSSLAGRCTVCNVDQVRTPGQRAGLTRARILDAAAELLARDGARALTMRAVAARLGVAPNAIYSHVAGKAELVDGVLDGVLAAVDAPAPAEGVDPVGAVHRLMSSTYTVLLRHPDLLPVYLARHGTDGENARRLGDTVRAHLAAAGVTGDAGAEGLRVLIVYTIGFAAFAADGPLPAAELRHNFDRGLGWLLAGIVQDGAPGRSGRTVSVLGVDGRILPT
jgi:TetR/AcrR family transcriptional regulator, tetracycline repressor protein